MKTMSAMTLLLAFCAGCDEQPAIAWTPMQTLPTPKYNIQVHVMYDIELDHAVVLDWVDQRADALIANKVAAGLGAYSDDEILAVITALPITVWDKFVINYTSGLWVRGGGFIYSTHIDVPTFTDYPTANGLFVLSSLWVKMVLETKP